MTTQPVLCDKSRNAYSAPDCCDALSAKTSVTDVGRVKMDIWEQVAQPASSRRPVLSLSRQSCHRRGGRALDPPTVSYLA